MRIERDSLDFKIKGKLNSSNTSKTSNNKTINLNNTYYSSDEKYIPKIFITLTIYFDTFLFIIILFIN
jgi:hypothetical protein